MTHANVSCALNRTGRQLVAGHSPCGDADPLKRKCGLYSVENIRMLLLIFLMTFSATEVGAKQGDPPAKKSITAQAEADYGKLPLYFIQNDGQVDGQVKFYEKGKDRSTYFAKDGVYLALTRNAAKDVSEGNTGIGDTVSQSVRLSFLNANPDPEITAEGLQDTKVNYFIGNDPKGWRTQVPTYRSVVYREVYPGIDIAFYGNNREMEYDVVVRPGGDPSQVRLAYEGIAGLGVDTDGNLEILMKEGKILQKRPVIYQEIDGKRVEVSGTFKLSEPEPGHRDAAPTTYGFELASYDRSHPLIIDPTLVYSTFIGGGGGNGENFESGLAIAADSSGNAYVTGYTGSPGFPSTPGAFDTTFNGGYSYGDAFVLKLNAAGTALVYATYLGGSNDGDRGTSIAVDVEGNAYVTGTTGTLFCSNFPTTPGAFSTSCFGGTDVFVTKLNATGSALVYSTLLGGSATEGNSFIGGSYVRIAVDSSGNAYVAGTTQSSNFPTTPGSFDPTFSADPNYYDVFVTKINPAGSALVYSTSMGGMGRSWSVGNDIAIDASGAAYITGFTGNADFPTTPGAYDTTFNGGYDVFVTKLNPAGSALVYSTFWGGSDFDYGNAIAVDGSGSAYVASGTVFKLNPTGSAMVYTSTVSGGGIDIAVDSSGNAYVVSTGSYSCIVTPDAYDATLNDTSYQAGDVCLVKLNQSGSYVSYGTYLGGASSDSGLGIAVGPSDYVYLTGYTFSGDFPVIPGAYDTTHNGNNDVFVTRFSGFTDYTDLIIPAVAGPTTVTRGRDVTVMFTARNYGSGTMGNGFRVGLYLSTDTTITSGDIYLGSRNVGALGPWVSSSGSLTATIPASLAAGTYYWGAIADIDGVVIESDELNNTLAGASVSVTVDPNPDTDGDGMPDAWEGLYGLDPNNPVDAGQDLDGDGSTSLREYQWHTVPNNASSVPPQTAPGDVDLSFGTGGKVTTDFTNSSVVSLWDEVHAMAIQPDGKVIAAGWSSRDYGLNWDSLSYDFSLSRYNPDGSLDKNFGKVLTNIYLADQANALALQTDGKIIVAGGSFGQFTLVRYSSDGYLDSSFGTGGMVRNYLPVGYGGAVSAMVIQQDGKIVTTGYATGNGAEDFVVARYNPNGSLDTTFNTDGFVTTHFSGSAGITTDGPHSLAIQSDGKYVMAGSHSDYATSKIKLVRYNTDGSLDSTFGVGGIVDGGVGNATSLAIQTDGKLVTAGSQLLRFNTDGSRDTTFTAGGGGNTLAIQFDGKIVVAGQTGIYNPYTIVLARYNPDGTPDSAFIQGVIDFGGNAAAYAVALQADGNIVVAGKRYSGLSSDGYYDYVLARYFGGGADLVVNQISGPVSGVTAGTVTLSDTIQNQGIQGSSGFTVGYYLSADTAITSADIFLGSRLVSNGLSVGAFSSGNANVTIPSGVPAGTYYLGAIADYTNQAREQNEFNNGQSGNTIAITGPDLVVSVVGGPTSWPAGATITISDTVLNQGAVDVNNPFLVGYYLSLDQTITTSDIYLGNRTIGSLSATSSDAGSTILALPMGVPAGPYYIGAIADYTNQIPETLETNNSQFGNTISVPSFSDLVISSVSSPYSTSGTVGGGIQVSSTAFNQGNTSSGAFSVGLYLSSDTTITTADSFLGSWSLAGLPAGGSSSSTSYVTIPSGIGGPYYVGGIADYLGQVSESVESNNALSGNTISITGPDLVMTAISGPSSGTIGYGYIALSDTVRNQGNYYSNAFYVSYYLSTDSVIRANEDIKVGDRYISGFTLAGSSNSGSINVMIPVTLPEGTYYLGAIADVANQTPETNDTNNAMAGNTIQVTLGDWDLDGLPAATDNCPTDYNPDQADNDQDGIGNVCDPDDDNDSMPDAWEVQYGLNPLDAADGSTDPDGDSLVNQQEYVSGTSPNNPDSDGDGIPDGWEVQHGLNPMDNTDVYLDPDGDGLSNLPEYQRGTDPHNADTDGDGMPDGWEVLNGLAPLNPADRDTDLDGDGVSNYKEYQMMTDPRDANSRPWIWAARYDNGYEETTWAGLASDSSGNTYVAGSSSNGTNSDLTTVKYDANGNMTWVARYNSGSNDHGGRIVVTSSYIYTLGTRFNGTNWDAIVVKYNTSGVQQCVAAYNSGGSDYVNSLTVDSSGNIYVLGSTSDATFTNEDILTLKFNSSCGLLWAGRYDNGGYDSPGYSIKTDSSGNVYVAGGSFNGINYDAVVIKYNASGTRLWASRYDNGGDDGVNNFTMDGSNNLYLSGSSSNGVDDDFLLLKYNANGTRLCTGVYDNGSWDYSSFAALDSSGNVYVAGDSLNGGNSDFAIVKYSSNCGQVWNARYDSGISDSSRWLKLDVSGNVYVSGDSFNGANTDYSIVKFDGNGNQLWAGRYDNAGEDYSAYGLELDSSGNVIVTGQSSNGVNSDFATVKINPSSSIVLPPADSDGDGLTDSQEVAIYGTNPNNADSDGDGMPDGSEVQSGLRPLNPSDAGQDLDGDGFTNLEEYVGQTDMQASWSVPASQTVLDNLMQTIRLVVPPSVTINQFTWIDPSTLPSAGTPFPYGLLGLTFSTVPGATVTVALTFPGPISTASVYNKYGPTASNPTNHWYSFSQGSNDGDAIITLTLTDGGAGDHDLFSNGTIVDPGGPSLPLSPSSWLYNISSRTYVGTGINKTVGGFIIKGTTPKKVLIRGRGPYMSGPPYNYAGTLSDPVLQLYSGSTVIAQNDNWQTVDPRCLAPAESCNNPIPVGMDPCQPNPGQTVAPNGCTKEASMVVTLPPGTYTAHLTGKSNGVGLGIVGVTEVNETDLMKLSNISTRSYVGTGISKTVGGFIIKGTTSKKVLIRGRGPYMSGPPYNYAGTLSDPVLQLYSGSTVIAQNDNWQTVDPLCLAPAESCNNPIPAGLDPCQPNPGQTVAPNGCTKEASMVVILPPGTYTAHLTGKNNGVGLGIVGVTDLSY